MFNKFEKLCDKYPVLVEKVEAALAIGRSDLHDITIFYDTAAGDYVYLKRACGVAGGNWYLSGSTTSGTPEMNEEIDWLVAKLWRNHYEAKRVEAAERWLSFLNPAEKATDPLSKRNVKQNQTLVVRSAH